MTIEFTPEEIGSLHSNMHLRLSRTLNLHESMAYRAEHPALGHGQPTESDFAAVRDAIRLELSILEKLAEHYDSPVVPQVAELRRLADAAIATVAIAPLQVATTSR